MKLEQLQSVWQAHHQQAAASQPSNFATEAIAKSVKFEKMIWWRDWIETLAAVFVIGAFGSMLYTDPLSLLSVLGVLIIIGGTLCAVWRLHTTRNLQSAIPPNRSLLECARVELERVERQIQLQRSITFWYTTPLTLGAILFVYGLLDPWWVAIIAAGGFLVIFVVAGLVIHWMNAHSVERSLIPLRHQLLDLIRSLEQVPSADLP